MRCTANRKRMNKNHSKCKERKMDNKIFNKFGFALGTTSRVPGSNVYHYLILDIDGKIRPKLPRLFRCRLLNTKHGWHVYTDLKLNLKDMLTLAIDFGADPLWCRYANHWGYAFLADDSYVKLPWPVSRMAITKEWNVE